jgi:molybdopterin-guanine dinucleotide biosynthesis protein A
MSATAVVLAAGHGHRAAASGLVGPKALLTFGGRSLVQRLLIQLDQSRMVSSSIIAVRPQDRVSIEYEVQSASAMPYSMVACSTGSSAETLQHAMLRAHERIVVVLAADLVVQTEELVRFLGDSIGALAHDPEVMSVQPVGADLSDSRCRFMVDEGGYLLPDVDGDTVPSEGPRVFLARPLSAAMEDRPDLRQNGMTSLVQYLLRSGWRMRGVCLRAVMDVDDRDDLYLANSYLANGTLDRLKGVT